MASNTVVFVLFFLCVYELKGAGASICHNEGGDQPLLDCVGNVCFIKKEFKSGKVWYSCLPHDLKSLQTDRCLTTGSEYRYVCGADKCNDRTVCDGWFVDDKPVTTTPKPPIKNTGIRCEMPTLAMLVSFFGVYFTV